MITNNAIRCVCTLWKYNIKHLVTGGSPVTGIDHVCTKAAELSSVVCCHLWNKSGFRPPLCTYRLNWARRTSWGWWDDWDDTVLQTQAVVTCPAPAEQATRPPRSTFHHSIWASARRYDLWLIKHQEHLPWSQCRIIYVPPPRRELKLETLAWSCGHWISVCDAGPTLIYYCADVASLFFYNGSASINALFKWTFIYWYYMICICIVYFNQ